eukprot:5619169-Pleurochrysis_carterae.AAC.1
MHSNLLRTSSHSLYSPRSNSCRAGSRPTPQLFPRRGTRFLNTPKLLLTLSAFLTPSARRQSSNSLRATAPPCTCRAKTSLTRRLSLGGPTSIRASSSSSSPLPPPRAFSPRAPSPLSSRSLPLPLLKFRSQRHPPRQREHGLTTNESAAMVVDASAHRPHLPFTRLVFDFLLRTLLPMRQHKRR